MHRQFVASEIKKAMHCYRFVRYNGKVELQPLTIFAENTNICFSGKQVRNQPTERVTTHRALRSYLSSVHTVTVQASNRNAFAPGDSINSQVLYRLLSALEIFSLAIAVLVNKPVFASFQRRCRGELHSSVRLFVPFKRRLTTFD